MSAPKHVTEQVIGSEVDYINFQRFEALASDCQKILAEHQQDIFVQNGAYRSAISEINKLKDILGDPAHILGSEKTKHGEIAEFIEVYIRNAKDLVNQRDHTATFEGVPRTGPVDYILNGIEVQSKFINGAKHSLNHVIEHMDKYTDFGRDGSFYQVPKDQFEIIDKLIKGEHVAGLNLNSQNTILNKVSEIEQITHRPFFEVVKPGISNYAEVQQGVVFNTVEGHKENILQQHNENLKGINERAKEQQNLAKENHQANFGEAATTAGLGAVIAGSLSLGMGIREKLKAGKRLNQFSNEDWKELGIDTAKASARGGITGAALYGMTNFTKLSSPVSAASISSGIEIAVLCKRYNENEISIDALYDGAQMICVDSGIVALGATVGSALIPVPVIGALLGSLIAKQVNDELKKWLIKDEQELIVRMNEEYREYREIEEMKLRAFISKVIEKYRILNGLVGLAFNYEFDVIARVDASIQLARECSMGEDKIVKNRRELDSFFGY